ncbi:MAG: DNA-3-methyladenine glycosylase [Longimicrobiales bacterium]
MKAVSAPLDRTFFARPAERVARDLLGAVAVSLIDGVETAGRIVETEAYVGPHDPASHGAERVGRTLRNRSMFGPPGIAYVYRSYGVHWCLNVVTDAVDYPAAVLIRALEPVHGLDIMRRRRFGAPTAPHRSGKSRGEERTSGAAPSVSALGSDTQLCSGPGKLTSALGITSEHDGHPLDLAPLVIVRGATVADDRIGRGPRIGITRAADWPLRFFVRDNPHVSRNKSSARLRGRGTSRAPR